MFQNGQIDIPAQAAGPTPTAASESVVDARSANVKPSFLAELARAMLAAAERERGRIAEVVADDAAENVEKTRTRADAETEELRRLAEADLERIQTWAATEMERIRREAERRTEGRRNDLEAYLAQHDSIIATEIDGVDAAVRGYRATLDQFFDELSVSTDPADIARRAGSLPAPPDLDDVRAVARAGAVAQLANAPQEATDEPIDDGLGWGVDADPAPRTEADADPAPPAEADADPGPPAEAHEGVGLSEELGAGLGVMDPDAVGRSEDLAEMPGEIDAEVADERATAPTDDLMHPSVGDAVEIDVGQPGDQSSAAVRLLRSIAPWTTPVDHDPEDDDTLTT
jgi:F0F1-type ATP synthase membrane subunit b/b'